MECRSIKYDVNKIINANLNLDLKGIKQILEENFKCVLSNQDLIYVEDTYVELLLKKWVQQAPGQLVRAIEPKQPFNFIKQIGSVKSLRDCCSLSNEISELSCLVLKLYNDHPTLQAWEDSFVFEFKQNCLFQVQLCIAKAEDHEIAFIHKFVNVLKHTLDLQEINNLFNLKNFVKDYINFKTLIKNVLKVKFPDSNVLALQQAGVQFIEQDYFSLSKDLKEIISKFFEPIVMKQFTENGRKVLEVSGTHIVLNKELEKLEKKLVLNQPDEVRFVKSSVLHANVNLNSSYWQGKNLLILAETLIVSDEGIVMDVSGAKGEEAGFIEDGDECGKNGADGMPGECGGNVLVLVESLEGGSLTITSNGGDGSKGLNGWKGADGVQGHYIDDLTMKSKIPPASYYNNSSKLGNLKKIKNSIFGDLNFVQVFYYNNTVIPITGQQNSLRDWLKKEELEDLYEELEDFYISGKTREGCEITFSFFYGGLFDRCQSYLLYKGAPGSQGNPGGVGGLGGSAGLAGDIEVRVGSSSAGTVKRIQNNGNPGENGRSGSRGNPGSRGADCGYMDKTLSNYWPKVFVTHPKDDTMLTIGYSSSSDYIYCPYKKEYAEIKEKTVLGRTLQQCSFETTLTQPNRQPVQAVRKKTMDLKNTITQYETNNFLGIDKLNSSFETVRRILDELIYSDTQTDLISEECKITNQVSYFQNGGFRLTSNLEDSTFDQLDTDPIESKIPLYKDSRYKLKVLKNLKIKNFQIDCPIAESILNFESNEYNLIFSISKTPAEFIDRYFCLNSDENRKEIQKLFHSLDKNQLCHSIIVFIKEYGSIKPKSKASIYLKRYHCLKKKSDTDERNIWMAIINFLERPDSRELYMKLCESINREDYALLLNVLDCIKKDNFLNKLYEHFQVKKKYDWVKAIKSKDEIELKKEMCQEIQNAGPLSEFYREFLSHYFDKNILVFIMDESGNYKLVSNHNLKAETKVYVLLRDEKFYELNVNIELAQLLHYQKDIGQLYSNILFHVDSLTKREEIEKIATISSFNSGNYEGVDKKTKSYVKVKQILTQDRDIKLIKNIFNSDYLISPRLQKLKANYIGYTNILHYMSLQLENEGKSISTEEFCVVLNFILESALTMPTSLPIISWIIASSPPKDWLIEVTLIKLEMYLGRKVENKMKDQWRQYISNQNEKSKLMKFFEKICKDSSKININSMEEVLYLMSFIPKAHVGLENIDLADWKYYLKDKYWLQKLKKTMTAPEDFIKQASLLFVLLDNAKGFENTNKFLNALLYPSIKWENECNRSLVLNVLRDLAHKDINLDVNFIQTLTKVSLCDWKGKIEKACFEKEDERSLQDLIQLIEKCGNTSYKITHNLRNIEKTVKSSTMIQTKINEQCHKKDQLEKWIESLLKSLNDIESNSYETKEKVDILKMIFKNDSYKSYLRLSLFKDLKYCTDIFLRTDFCAIKKEIIFAAISVVINEVMSKTLRNTQKLSTMIFLMSERNVLAQISTGEGKSLIVVCLAIMKVIDGEKVDIVTSSKVLAERDAKEYSEIYKLFGLTVGHNCSENLEDRKRVYSKCDVVYGELSNFQRDFLLDRMYDQNILGDRNIETMTIIVDEVDSLILDKASNTLYLSHEIPGLDKLEPVFVYIWKWLNTPTGKTVCELKEEIQIALGQINRGKLRELDASLNVTEVKKIWDVLVNKSVIDQNGILMKDEIDYDSLNNETKGYINISLLKYMFMKVINSEKQFVIPNYLKSFVHRHLDGWIESAQMAMAMESDKHYVVDIDRSGTSTERNPNIIILDVDTGTDQSNSQWDNGLHQFLQLKHGCKLFSISLKAVFISNVSFIKKYKRLYGLSGTLGTSIERKLLTSLYDVEYVTIPTAKAKQFYEMIPIKCNNKADWVNQIVSSAYEISSTRSALIICNNVIDVTLLENECKKFLEDKNAPSCYKVHTYKRDYEQLKVANDLKQHQIIISTNLAGRGTDIKLSPELTDAGGLHVCLSFLPINSRVGEQAYGRVSRNGQPGTAQMIFMSACENSVSKITDLQQQRNLDEIHRVTNIKHIYETQILAEENCFKEFQEQFLNLKKKVEHSEKVKSLLLQICLDKWAYWLDENVGAITSVSIDKLVDDLSNIAKWNFKEDSSCIKDPFQLTKLGLIHLQEKDYETSMFLFNKVIREEKYFSYIALYYRVCTKAAINDLEPSNISDILDDFTLVQHLLKKLILSSQMSSHCIDWLKSRNANSIIQIDSFKEQQRQKCDIYNLFVQSIDDIIGHEVLPTDLVMLFSSEQGDLTAFRVYNKCMEAGVLKMPLLKPLKESDLIFTLEYGIHPEEIKKLLKENKEVIGNIFLKNNFLKNLNDQVGNEFMKKLKQLLPSQELFWNELLEKKVLVHEVKFIFIDVNRLDQEMPSLKSVINNFTTDVPTDNKNVIWFYKKEEIKVENNDDIVWMVVERSKFMSVIGDETFRYLKMRGIILCNKQAIFSSHLSDNKPIKFGFFDSLRESDFIKCGMDIKVARTIIAELIACNIIKKCKKSSLFSLKSDEEGIEKIQLLRYPAYSNDVKCLLTHKFSFRIAYQKLVYLVSQFGIEGDKLILALQPNLYKSFFGQLQENLLTAPRANFPISKALQKIYSCSLQSEKWVEVFSKFFNSSYAVEIVNSLKNNEILKKCKFNSQYFINCKKPCVNEDNKICSITLSEPLPEHLAKYKEFVEFILLDYLKLCERFSHDDKVLNEYVGQIYSKDVPSFDFKPLLSLLNESGLPKAERNSFCLNGFDQLLIVKEKLYTFKMKRNVFLVTLVGIAEIAVGVAFAVYFPVYRPVLGRTLLLAGVGDLIYSISSLYSGYFSTSQYIKYKIMSLMLSAISSVPSIYRSMYGKQSTGLSMKNIKALFDGKVENKENSGAMSIIVQRIVKTSSLAIGIGVKNTMIHQVIRPHLETLVEHLAAAIYSNIDEVIVNHKVIQSVRHMYMIYGEEKARIIIQNCFQKAIDKKMVNSNQNLVEVFKLCRTVLDGCLTSLSSYNEGCDSNLLVFGLKLAEVSNNVIQLISNCQKIWSLISSLVSKILNDFEHNLEKKFSGDCRQLQVNKEFSEELCNHFVSHSIEGWKKGIKSVLSNNINELVLYPLMHHTSNRLQIKLLDYTIKDYSFFSDKEIDNISKSKPLHKIQNKNDVQLVGSQSFVESEFNKLLFNILKTNRSASVFAEISKRNLPVDMNCVEMCCELLPILMKKEGFEVPSFEIVLDINGVEKRYKTRQDGSKCTTIYLTPDEGILGNINNNRSLCITTVLNTMATSILPPEVHNVFGELVSNVLAKMESNESTLSQLSLNNKQSGSFIKFMDLDNENELDCQHKEWKFKPSVHIDPRGELQSCSGSVEKYILKGFEAALAVINEFISMVLLDTKHSINLDLQDFKELDFKLWPNFEPSGFPFNCHPESYELMLPLPKDNDVNTFQNFLITMKLNNRPNKRTEHRSRGAHIMYEVCPLASRVHLNKSMRGYVLLSAECQRVTHTVEQCHVAGELITPSGCRVSLHRNDYDVLIIGDAEFKKTTGSYIGEHCRFKCKVVNYQKSELGEIKNEISVICKKYRGTRCAVLYFGTSTINFPDKKEKIAHKILDIIIELNSCLGNVNIILCSFEIQKSHSSTKLVKKVIEVNRYLSDFFDLSDSITYVELMTQDRLSWISHLKWIPNLPWINKKEDLIIKEIEVKLSGSSQY